MNLAQRLLVTAAALALVLVAASVAVSGTGMLPALVLHEQTVTDEQIVTALKKEEQVVLLSLGIQGIVSDESTTKLFGLEVPGADRAQFVQYSYLAKLGIEGKQVAVEKTGDRAYRVSIPDFVFIGHDKEQFKVAVQKDGVMSWITPEIDTARLVTGVLSVKTQNDHITANRQTLEEQTREFYSGIITGIDPGAKVSFSFAGHR